MARHPRPVHPCGSARQGRLGGAQGRDAATLSRFFTELGPERLARLEAISADMGAGYAKAISERADAGTLTARICIDLPRREAR